MIPSLELLKKPELICASARHYIDRILDENGQVSAYLDLALQLVAVSPSKVALESILGVVAGVPKLALVLTSKMDMLKLLLNNSKEDVRELTAQIMSIVVCQTFDEDQLHNFVSESCKGLKDKPLELQHGLILTAGYTIGRIMRTYLDRKSIARDQLERNCVDSLGKTLSPTTSTIVEYLFNSQPLLSSAACLAVGEMARCGPLLNSQADRAVEKLVSMVIDAKTNGRIRERAALAAGYLSVGQLEYPKRRYIIETFLASAQVWARNSCERHRRKFFCRNA